MLKKTLCLFAILFLLPGAALAERFQEGNQYRVNDREHRFSEAPREVVEFFWYGCGGCYAFYPATENWKDSLPDDVEFVRVPAVLNPRWRLHGKAFYVAESLGMTDEIHEAMFKALHEERRQINDQDAMRELFVEKGADADEFDEAFDSFQVDSKLRRAENLARRFSISSTPSVVVNGQYVTDLSEAGGVGNLVELGNWLLEQD